MPWPGLAVLVEYLCVTVIRRVAHDFARNRR